ncbi:cyanidin 3-O-galactoside 2''-O-xylosyltransferase FGGT1-like [Cornus florida]|uniref:cyanidin 3-O-galactoside 2''-O-xylosyltransferase FGGT1-like n=1 Tax=Cornus florida TaxID=4283 RepID=UPI0028987840|nr:cyanidin 3-O-galactoside 2''-O-xylosyltransferase FGGT1-like [Cornus florida]
MGNKAFHIVMYPWFALGHLTAHLHISNKLAERGYKISFFIPNNTQPKLEHFNLHPDLINFISVNVPHVDGLPPGAETTADVPYSMQSLIMAAMDLTKPTIEAFLKDLKPNFVFFDFAHWLPALARPLGIKCIHYCIISPATIGYLLSPARRLSEKHLNPPDLMEPPLGFPLSSIKLSAHEARELSNASVKEYGIGVSFTQRLLTSFTECDAICFKSCNEIEGPYSDYLENQFKKPVILAGPVVPEQPTSTLEEQWAKWLDNFKAKTVIFCAFGSECVLKSDQFQELVLGLELTGMPFFAALKPPVGAQTIESALPEGFQRRTEERGVVHGGWVQQQLILGHPSVGCFVTHCGSGSLSEAMVNDCQLVLMPHVGDQIINARLMGGDLKVGVEVEKGEEDGNFTREGVCKAIRSVMEVDGEVGKEVMVNHAKWKEFLLSKGLESSYMDSFIQKLHVSIAISFLN